MPISKGNIIKLDNGAQYFIIKGKEINGRNFCIASTAVEPFEIKMLEMRKGEEGTVETRAYNGEDYADILAIMLEVNNGQ